MHNQIIRNGFFYVMFIRTFNLLSTSWVDVHCVYLKTLSYPIIC